MTGGASNADRALTVWILTDGKAGHRNQMRGLMHALRARALTTSHEATVSGGAGAWIDLLLGRFPAARDLPDPDLILCAGRRSHVSALAARRARGGRVVVLMRPSLPMRWFDVCLMPRHDARDGDAPDRVVQTLGALCDVRPSDAHDDRHGVILIGGPSKRHRWNDDGVVTQVRAIVEKTPHVTWRLTTSRRTPEATETGLRAIASDRLIVTPASETKPGWVHDALSSAGSAWVTEDSVSMVYEALTSGCAVGALPVKRTSEDRVTRGVDALATEGLITTFAAWRGGAALRAPNGRIDEAARCAALLLDRWFPDRTPASVSSPRS